MKIKGNEVIYLSPNGNVAVSYSIFDLGDKYKIHKKAVINRDFNSSTSTYETDFHEQHQYWKYVASFGFVGQAVEYAKKIFDKPYVI